MMEVLALGLVAVIIAIFIDRRDRQAWFSPRICLWCDDILRYKRGTWRHSDGQIYGRSYFVDYDKHPTHPLHPAVPWRPWDAPLSSPELRHRR